MASLWSTVQELPLLLCCCLLQLCCCSPRRGTTLCQLCVMLMLMHPSALFTALDSRPIRSSRDGYVATACHGSLLQMRLYMHMYGWRVLAYRSLLILSNSSCHRHKVRQAPQGLENMKFAIESTGCENDVLAKSIEDCTEPSLLNSSNK